MIAYFLADVLWQLTSWLASVLIDLFSFAFSLDLVNGSEATGGAGASARSRRRSTRSTPSTFGAPWLVSRWRSPASGRCGGAGAAPLLRDGRLAGLSLIYVTAALLRRPARADHRRRFALDHRVSTAFLAVSRTAGPRRRRAATGADQLF